MCCHASRHAHACHCNLTLIVVPQPRCTRTCDTLGPSVWLSQPYSNQRLAAMNTTRRLISPGQQIAPVKTALCAAAPAAAQTPSWPPHLSNPWADIGTQREHVANTAQPAATGRTNLLSLGCRPCHLELSQQLLALLSLGFCPSCSCEPCRCLAVPHSLLPLGQAVAAGPPADHLQLQPWTAALLMPMLLLLLQACGTKACAASSVLGCTPCCCTQSDSRCSGAHTAPSH